MERKADKDLEILKFIKKEYVKDDIPWFIGYSGGKDSSCVLKLVINAINELKIHHKKITVFYCDTGVENPIITDYVYSVFNKLKDELSHLPIELKILKPKLSDRFFVKVIGRGYPTPTNIFRWCTDKLRINPVNNLLSLENGLILLGIRKFESEQRDRTINKHLLEDYYLNQINTSRRIFSPILNHSLEDLWITLSTLNFPTSIDFKEIRDLYQDAENECPIIKTNKEQPCGNSRFGCWTCTVVRKDKSISNLVANGYEKLRPLNDFRNWVYEFRDNLEYRAKIRRNKTKGLGPITLKGRKIILNELFKAQDLSGYRLIQDDEIQEIYKLWEMDKEISEFQ